MQIPAQVPLHRFKTDYKTIIDAGFSTALTQYFCQTQFNHLYHA